MTTLYLIRHGIAAERGTYANDDERPLTDAGIEKTHRVAERLQQLRLNFDLILSSPLVRARQTAEILNDHQLGQTIEISEALAPAGPMQDWLRWLQDWQPGKTSTLALVGHQPDLGNWAETLVWGMPTDRLVVKKAGVIGLSLPVDHSPVGASDLFWLTPPRLLL